MSRTQALSGRVALVTGGSSGIGETTVRCLLDAGATVYATGIDNVAAAQSRLPEAVLIRSDAGSNKAVAALADRVRREQRKLDILMLNAGLAAHGDLASVTEEAFDRVFAVNVKGVLFGAAAFAPLMSEGGSIIITTSIAGQMGMARTHLYSASKAAAGALVRTLASELAPRGIRVNGIAPGSIETGLGAASGVDPATRQRMIESVLARVPMKRRGLTEEIASVAMFLASAASSYLTGQELIVDGGMLGQG